MPMLTMFLRDVENETFLFHQKHKAYHSLYDAATNALESFFDKHFSIYTAASPKSFILYFQAPEVGCGYYDVKLIVGENKKRKEYIGAPEWNTEETYPYEYDMGKLKNISENEFCGLEKLILPLAGISAPGVNRLAERIRKDFE